MHRETGNAEKTFRGEGSHPAESGQKYVNAQAHITKKFEKNQEKISGDKHGRKRG